MRLERQAGVKPHRTSQARAKNKGVILCAKVNHWWILSKRVMWSELCHTFFKRKEIEPELQRYRPPELALGKTPMSVISWEVRRFIPEPSKPIKQGSPYLCPRPFWKGVETGERRAEDDRSSLPHVLLSLHTLRATVLPDFHNPHIGEAGKELLAYLTVRERNWGSEKSDHSFIHLFNIYCTLGGDSDVQDE